MIKLTKTIQALNSGSCKKVAKEEIQNIEPDLLPLQQGLSLSSYVSNMPFSAVILNIKEENNSLNIKTGIFYTGIIAGCSCSDDPSPTDEQNEYCELQFSIDKDTADTEVKILEC